MADSNAYDESANDDKANQVLLCWETLATSGPSAEVQRAERALRTRSSLETGICIGSPLEGPQRCTS